MIFESDKEKTFHQGHLESDNESPISGHLANGNCAKRKDKSKRSKTKRNNLSKNVEEEKFGRPPKAVINKGMLRMVKRYYLNLFKKNYSQYSKKRFSNVHSKVLIKALERFTNKFLGVENDRELATFLFRFLKLNSRDDRKLVTEGEMNAQTVLELMYQYKARKFNNMPEIRELKILLKHFLSQDFGDDNSLSLAQKNFKPYLKGLKDMAKLL
jgi:hypothetical protein